MLENLDRAKVLDLKIDTLIDRYGHENPELVSDLTALKDELRASRRRGAAAQIAGIALRIATWARFVADHWPDI